MPKTNTYYPIDAVFTWVDGHDELHRKKIQNYQKDSHLLEDKNFLTRYNSVNEIEFAVKSILKFAPYIRTIFIVTDQQTPSFLEGKNKLNYSKVKIIDHKEIFKGYEAYLPTFNSISIESMIFRIPNLAEHFVYFNDDFFLFRKTIELDFFKQEHPVIRGKWNLFDEHIFYKLVYQKLIKLLVMRAKEKKHGYKKCQQNIARTLGFKKYLRINHTPTALRKSTLKNYFDQYPDMLIHNIKHKFRHIDQFMIQSLGNHLEIKNDTCELKQDNQLVYFQSYKKSLFLVKRKLNKSNQNNNKLFLCLQSLDLCQKQKLDFLLDWLNNRME